MGYEVTCICGKVLQVSQGMAGSSMSCSCGRTVPVSLPSERPSQGIMGFVPPTVPDLQFLEQTPPRPSPPAEVIGPMQVYFRTEGGNPPHRHALVMAALTRDGIWIQDAWQLRIVPLQSLRVE